MKTAGCFLLALVLASSGCVEFHGFRREPEPPPPPPAPVKVERPATPVIPAQVTEGNAHAKADALDDEIARDEQPETEASASEQASPEKP
jgi:hypothetical protein